MRRVMAAAALAAIGFAPAIGTACEYEGASSASATPPRLLASAPAPEATQVPASKVAKTPAPKAVKPVVDTAKAPVRDQKVAAVTTN